MGPLLNEHWLEGPPVNFYLGPQHTLKLALRGGGLGYRRTGPRKPTEAAVLSYESKKTWLAINPECKDAL